VLLTAVGNRHAGGDEFAERAGTVSLGPAKDGWYGVVLEDAFLLYLHQAVVGCELLAILAEVTRLIPGGLRRHIASIADCFVAASLHLAPG
jgi:hypothetical protein